MRRAGAYGRLVKVVIAGGSGTLGRALSADLVGRGHEVVVLTRRLDPASPYRQAVWDGVSVGAWAGEVAGAAVVNLAGALVDRRPTAANIEVLTTSRVQPTRALAAAAASLDQPVAVWVQASTAAIYGDAGESTLSETSPPADGPAQMTDVARAWEAAATDLHATRTVVLRTSIVLQANTPALDRLVLLTRLGLGGRIASGQQWFSWIHVHDWLAITRTALTCPDLSGVVAATSPNPVRNAELMAELRVVLKRPIAPPTPAALVRIGAWLMRTDPALGLTGRRVLPERLQAAGFTFTYPQLRPALSDLLANPEPAQP